MPCLLKPDPRKAFCALGKADDKPLVCVEGPPTLKITQATFNSDPVPVLPKNRIQLPALRMAPTGTNALNLIVEGVNPKDVLTLLEQCEPDDQDDTIELCTKKIGTAPGGGAEPFVSFRIHAD